MKFLKLIIFFLIVVLQAANAQDAPIDTSKTIITLLPDMYLAKLQESGNPVIIDVRDKSNYKNYRIQGSVYAENKNKLRTIIDTLDHGEPVFVYCEVGFRSNQVSKILKDEGFTTIYNLKKGIRNWKKEHFPIEKMSRHEQKKNE